MHDDRDHVISVVLTHEDWKEFVKLQPQPAVWLRERIQEIRHPRSRPQATARAQPRGPRTRAPPPYYFCGWGFSEYDVRLITRMSGRFTFTSILRVRFSGSGFVDE